MDLGEIGASRYFDLSQYHGSDAGLHATRTSRLRSVLWSLCHMPLLGTVFWISTALATLLDGKNDGAPDWEFGALYGRSLTERSFLAAFSGSGSFAVRAVS